MIASPQIGHTHSTDFFMPEYDEPAAIALGHQAAPDSLAVAANQEETPIVNVRQMTFGGQNAKAYWNRDGKKITYQSSEKPKELIAAFRVDPFPRIAVTVDIGLSLPAGLCPL